MTLNDLMIKNRPKDSNEEAKRKIDRAKAVFKVNYYGNVL